MSVSPPETIPPVATRVTFDKTFKGLRILGLIEAKPEQPYRSRYLGMFLHGYSYRLTEKGKLLAVKMKKELAD